MIRVTIQPCDVFNREVLQSLGFRDGFLDEEIGKMNLKVCSLGGRELFIGSDVLNWIRKGQSNASDPIPF